MAACSNDILLAEVSRIQQKMNFQQGNVTSWHQKVRMSMGMNPSTWIRNAWHWGPEDVPVAVQDLPFLDAEKKSLDRV